jgi:hypothetical protein
VPFGWFHRSKCPPPQTGSIFELVRRRRLGVIGRSLSAALRLGDRLTPGLRWITTNKLARWTSERQKCRSSWRLQGRTTCFGALSCFANRPMSTGQVQSITASSFGFARRFIHQLLVCRTGQTALHCAASHGNSDVAAALIVCGADLEARDSLLADTPWMSAGRNHHEEGLRRAMDVSVPACEVHCHRRNVFYYAIHTLASYCF